MAGRGKRIAGSAVVAPGRGGFAEKMIIPERKQILSTVSPKFFVGREREFERLLRHAENTGRPPHALLVLSAPNMGASEILRQVYDQLFFELGEVIPFYIAVKNTDRTVRQFALRFLHTFLQQTVAYRRQDSQILEMQPDICEIGDFAFPIDIGWINKLISACESESELNNDRAFIRTCLSAPLRAAAAEAVPFVMIDDLHKVLNLEGEIDLIDELKDIYSNANFSYVFSGRRRFIYKISQTGTGRLNEAAMLQIEPLSFVDSGILVETLADKYGVKISEETRDLIAQRFIGSPTFIKYLFQAASEKNFELKDFQSIERIYTEELFGGRIGHYYDTIFDEIAPNVEIQKRILGLLYDSLTLEKERAPIESWQNRVGLKHERFYRAMRLLNIHEIVRISSNMLETMEENVVSNDYIKARFRLEVVAEPRVLVVAKALKRFLKRAPQTMSKFYRRSSAVGLRELLGVFDCQKVPTELIDYENFRERHRGKEDFQILKDLEQSAAHIVLPQIVYTAYTSSFYREIDRFAENAHSAVAIGFQTPDYTDENEIVWIAAEIESKLEADEKQTEFWCDRLEMVALMCNFSNFKIWLVAPEGFTPEALAVLKKRDAYGSSRKQVELLISYLNAEEIVGERLAPNEYEMIIPMGDDTELIAANAVEEIARRHSFDSKAINQIKTALVEAFINAAEHSHSPDRKIYQKFKIEGNKITITISNRGVRMNGKRAREVESPGGRRGWGLKLMRTLMDEVKFEEVDDGTRISMTKYVNK